MADKTPEEIHKLALERFQQVESKERDQRALAVEDTKFAQTEDGQWDENAVEKRKNRPRYTINRVAGAVDQLIGDQRQNRTNIKVRPVSGGASEDTAKTFEGLIRNIEEQSDAQHIYSNAFDEVVNGGYGGWRVVTEFTDDSFDQEIFIKPILGAATSMWFEPSSQHYDKRDAGWAFLTMEMSKAEHEEKYPNSPAVGFSQEQYNYPACRSWFRGEDTVRVAEYWVKTPVTKTIALLSDGRVIDLDEDGEALDELAAKGVTVIKQREAKSHKVEMYKMDGGGILGKVNAWAGKFIPLIPAYGRQAYIEGHTYNRGIVRFAKDPARIYNYTTSSAIETTALTPKDPIWYTPKQAEGFGSEYRNFNVSNTPFMPYNPDPQSPGPPVRGGAPAVQTAFMSQIQQASMDLYHVTGMQPPSLGANPELKSGKAIQAQERLGDRGQYVFTDNLERSENYCGEILIDLIPRIYDTARQASILAQDGETELVQLNEMATDDDGKEIIVNDLALGKYTVVTETGPAFATQRQESAQQIIELIAQSPTFEALAMDLVAKDLPILESKELTKRVRKVMIGQGVVEPTEEETKELGLDQEQQPDPQQAAITENIQIQTEKLISDIENQDAKTLQVTVDTQNSTIKAYQDYIKALQTKLDAGIPLNGNDRSLMIKQQDIMEEAQDQIDEGPNSEQAADIVSQGLIQAGGEAEGAPRLTVEQPTSQDIIT